MADIAALGLELDSSGLLKGKTALDAVVVSSGKAEKATSGLQNAFSRIEKLISSVERAVRDVERALKAMASSADGTASSVAAAASAAASAGEAMDRVAATGSRASGAYEVVGAAARGAASAVAQAATVAVSAAERSAVANDNMGRSARDAANDYARLSSVMQQVNAITGASRAVGSAGRADDIAAYGAALDEMRAKVNPAFAALQSYRSELDYVDRALKVGAISETEHARAIALTTAAYQAQIAQARQSAGELLNAANAAKSAVEKFVSIRTVSPDRAADITAYGAALDGMRAKFSPLYAAISRYKTTLAEIKTAHQVGAISADEMAAAISRERQAALGSIAAIKGLNAGIVSASAPMQAGTYHAANLAAQFQDVAVTAAMGMNPMQIALQQGTQMAMVFSTMSAEAGKGASALSVLGGAFSTVFSPASLLIIGITALAAGLLQLVPWAKLAQNALNGLAAVLPTIAPYAAAAAAGLALLYAPAIISGVTSVIAAISRLVVMLGTLLVTAAIANPFAAFVAGTAVAIAAMVAFRDDLKKIFGVDIVGVMKDWANWIINLMRAAIAQLTVEWNNYPELLRLTAAQAANSFISAIEWMVNKAKDGFNQIIAAANAMVAFFGGDYLKQAFGWKMEVPTLGDISLGRIDESASSKLKADAEQLQKDIKRIMSEDTLGNLGSAIGKGASAASSKLKEWAKGLTEVDKKSKKAGKTEADKYADILSGADRRIASLKAEAAALGLTDEAAARLKHEQDLLNQASQKDITLSAAQRSELSAKAAEMAKWEVAAKKVKEAYDFVRDAAKGFLSDLRSGLQDGESFWTAFGDAALNVLNKIIDKIEGQFIDALMNALSVTNSGSGLFGNLLSGFGFSSGGTVGGTTGATYGFASGGVVHAASGGQISGPGTATSDSIPAMLSRGEFVVNAAAAKQSMPLLQAINDNAVVRMAAGGAVSNDNAVMRLAAGGEVQPTAVPARSYDGGRAGSTVKTSSTNVTMSPVYNITTGGSGSQGDTADIKKALAQSNADLEKAVRAVLVDDMRKMGPVATTMRNRFGLNPTRGIG